MEYPKASKESIARVKAEIERRKKEDQDNTNKVMQKIYDKWSHNIKCVKEWRLEDRIW